MSELRPCPFCGNRNVVVDTCGSDEVLFVRCDVCHATGPAEDEDHLSETSIKWNTRPIEDALRAKVSELTRQLSDSDQSITNLLREREQNLTRIIELTRLLGEAEEGIRRLTALASFFHLESEHERDDFDNPDCERGHPGHWKIYVDPATNDGYPARDPFTEAGLVFNLPAVQRALKGASS